MANRKYQPHGTRGLTMQTPKRRPFFQSRFRRVPRSRSVTSGKRYAKRSPRIHLKTVVARSICQSLTPHRRGVWVGLEPTVRQGLKPIHLWKYRVPRSRLDTRWKLRGSRRTVPPRPKTCCKPAPASDGFDDNSTAVARLLECLRLESLGGRISPSLEPSLAS